MTVRANLHPLDRAIPFFAPMHQLMMGHRSRGNRRAPAQRRGNGNGRNGDQDGSSASANGGVSAQLVGTDRVGSTLDAVTATAGAAVNGTAQTATGAASTAQFIAGNTASATRNCLAAADSAAGSVAIAPAMLITGSAGQMLGTVSQLIVYSRGFVEYALVDLDG